MITDGAAQGGILRFERVEDRALGHRTSYFELDLLVDIRQRSQVVGQDNADHGLALPLHSIFRLTGARERCNIKFNFNLNKRTRIQ